MPLPASEAHPPAPADLPAHPDRIIHGLPAAIARVPHTHTWLGPPQILQGAHDGPERAHPRRTGPGSMAPVVHVRHRYAGGGRGGQPLIARRVPTCIDYQLSACVPVSRTPCLCSLEPHLRHYRLYPFDLRFTPSRHHRARLAGCERAERKDKDTQGICGWYICATRIMGRNDDHECA